MDSLVKYGEDKSFAPRAWAARHRCCLQPFRAFKCSSSKHHLWSAYFWHSFKRVWCRSLCLVQRGQNIFQRSFPVCTRQVKPFSLLHYRIQRASEVYHKCRTRKKNKTWSETNSLTTPHFFLPLEYDDDPRPWRSMWQTPHWRPTEINDISVRATHETLVWCMGLSACVLTLVSLFVRVCAPGSVHRLIHNDDGKYSIISSHSVIFTQQQGEKRASERGGAGRGGAEWG